MIKLTIEELQERWEMLFYEMGIEKVLVTENFPHNGERKFIVYGLAMELIDNIVMCYDADDIIINNSSAIMAFLRERLTNILLIPLKDGCGYIERLEFGDHGIVFIEKAS
jgi:hypothetical protein